MPLWRVDDWAESPEDAHSLVLRLVGELKDRHGEPVEHETLQWYADMADRAADPQGSLEALDRVLGPRPRRANLLVVLGDLVDNGLLRQEPEGFWVTDEGRKMLEGLGDRVASFDAVIA